jgi:hypothetical protein
MYVNTIQILTMKFIQLFIDQNIILYKPKMHQATHKKLINNIYTTLAFSLRCGVCNPACRDCGTHPNTH